MRFTKKEKCLVFNGHSPSGKAQDFDSCIRWFESSWPSLADVAELADAPDLGSGPRRVQVRFLSSAVESYIKEHFL